MGDPLNNPFAQQQQQQSLFRQLQGTQALGNMNNGNARIPQGPPPLGTSIPSIPGGVQDPDQAKIWKTIGDQFRNIPNGGNPAQVSIKSCVVFFSLASAPLSLLPFPRIPCVPNSLVSLTLLFAGTSWSRAC